MGPGVESVPEGETLLGFDAHSAHLFDAQGQRIETFIERRAPGGNVELLRTGETR